MTLDGLRGHCNQLHPLGEKQVVCPVCKLNLKPKLNTHISFLNLKSLKGASMPWGDPEQPSIDFIGHLNLRHKFEYDNYVDLNASEEDMVEKALADSINQLLKMNTNYAY